MKTKRHPRATAPYVAKVQFAKYHRGKIAQAIVDAYARVPGFVHKPRPPVLLRSCVLTITASGLGDCVVLSDIPRTSQCKVPIWAGCKHFLPLMEFNEFFRFPGDRMFLTDGLDFIYHYDCGPGHLIQMWQRTYGLQVSYKPSGYVNYQSKQRFKDRVILHFEPDQTHALEQKTKLRLHPQPREVYPQNLDLIESFIARNPGMEFIEIGYGPKRLRRTTYVETKSVADLVSLMASASWFLGVVSGPMHLATALGLRCIVLCNMPSADRIVLPALKRSGTVEEEWLYPQNVHLHQDSFSALVPKLTPLSLEAAFAGDVYPFWQDDWLQLIDTFTS